MLTIRGKSFQVILITILIMTIFSINGCTNPASVDSSIIDALKDVPNGQGVDQNPYYDFNVPGIHPVVLLDMSGNKHVWTDKLPVKWIPGSLEDVEIVVSMGEEKELELQICEYIGGPDIVRIQYYREVFLREAKTAEIIDSFNLYGTKPRECEAEEDVAITRLEGSHPTREQLESRLEPYVVRESSTLQDLVWNKTLKQDLVVFSPQSVIQLSDGGFAITGFSRTQADGFLLRMNKFGHVIWNKSYGGSGGDGFNAVIETSDGGFALAGTTGSYGAGGADSWLVKVDADGLEEWSRTYGGTRIDAALSLIQTSDGGYALGGMTEPSGGAGYFFWLVKTDSMGIIQWNQMYRGEGASIAYSMTQTSDGGFALAGETTGIHGYDFCLIKTDENGNEEWKHSYGSIYEDRAYSLIQTSDGGFAMAGFTTTANGDEDFTLVKADSSGIEVFNKTYGGNAKDVARALIQSSDGGFILFGDTREHIAATDFLLVKTDDSGVLQWNKTYHGWLGSVQPLSVTQTSDGGFLMVGMTGSFIWLAKSGSDENG